MTRFASSILAKLPAISNDNQKENGHKRCGLEFCRRLHGVTSSEDGCGDVAAAAVAAAVRAPKAAY